MTWWVAAWLVVLALGALLELVAVMHEPGSTLSEQIWRLLGIGREPTVWIWCRRALFLVFWVWLTCHLLGIQLFV